jgi:hypothetical protein
MSANKKFQNYQATPVTDHSDYHPVMPQPISPNKNFHPHSPCVYIASCNSMFNALTKHTWLEKMCPICRSNARLRKCSYCQAVAYKLSLKKVFQLKSKRNKQWSIFCGMKKDHFALLVDCALLY